MSKSKCLTCGQEYFPRQHNQRFCCKACNDVHYNAERRRAMELLRSQTYFGRELMSAAEGKGSIVQVGGIGGALPAPNWAVDPTGTEPALGIDIEAVPEEARR